MAGPKSCVPIVVLHVALVALAPLSASDIPSPHTDLVAGGDFLSGRITAGKRSDTYRLQIDQPGTYQIETDGYSQVRIALFGPGRREKRFELQATTDRDWTPDLVNRRVRVSLAAGEYFAEVHHARTGGSGEYRIRLLALDLSIPLPAIDTGKKSDKLALLVGIDEYQADWIPDLRGCVHDVEDMRDLLTRYFGFADEDVLVLTNAQATHENIIQAYRKHLIGRANDEAVVVFHYSGHGSQMLDQEDGDEVYDGKDETIVPHDSRLDDRFDIRDDELNGLFRELSTKTRHVTFVLDSCHSGSGIRGTGVPRRIEEDLRKPPPAQAWEISSRGGTDKDTRFENPDYVLIAGCRDKELAFELELNGIRRGAMTYYLAREIRESSKAGLTYQDVMEQVKANVTRENPAQHPQIEGRLIHNLVFSTESRPSAGYVLVSPDAGSLVLQAGRVHSLAAGSTFAVFPPRTSELGDPRTAVAQVELTSVDVLASRAKVIQGRLSDIRPQSRAVELQRAYAIERFPVRHLEPHEAGAYCALHDLAIRTPAESAILQAVEAKIQENPHIQLVADLRHARLLLADAAGRVHILRSSGEEVAVRDGTAADRIMEEIERWAKWHNLLAIENRRSQDIRVNVEVQAMEDAGSRDPTETDRVPMLSFTEGDRVRLRVENAGRQPFFFTILNLSSDGSVTVLHSADTEALLPNRQTFYPGEGEGPIEAFVPEGMKKTTDHIKVIATTEPVDFRFVEMEGSRARDAVRRDDPLTRLFQEAAAQSRTKSERKTAVADWATADAVFQVVQQRGRLRPPSD